MTGTEPTPAPTPEARAAALELAAALERLSAREQALEGPSRLTVVASTLAVVAAGLAAIAVAYGFLACAAWEHVALAHAGRGNVAGAVGTTVGTAGLLPVFGPCPLAGSAQGLLWGALGLALGALFHVGRGGAGRPAGSLIAAGGLPVFVLASVLLADASDVAHVFQDVGSVVNASAIGASLGLVAGVAALCAALANPREGASATRFASALVERPSGAALPLSFALAPVLGFVAGGFVYATPDSRLPGALQGSALALALALGASAGRSAPALLPLVAAPLGLVAALARTWGERAPASLGTRTVAAWLEAHGAPPGPFASAALVLAAGLLVALALQALGQRVVPVARVLGSTAGLAALWLLLEPDGNHPGPLPALWSVLSGAAVLAFVPLAAEALAVSLAPRGPEAAG